MKIIGMSAAWAFAGLLPFSHQALAATATAELQVTATVPASCVITTTPVNFGNYDSVAEEATVATGTVTVNCVKGTALAVGLSSGNSPGTNSGERAMTNTASSAERLTYFLYKPAAGATSCTGSETDPWGAIDTERLALAPTTTNEPVSYNVCGKVNPQQNVPAGTYQDTVTATVYF